MDDGFLKTHLINIASDWAAVPKGKVSGLIARLKNNFLNVQSVCAQIRVGSQRCS